LYSFRLLSSSAASAHPGSPSFPTRRSSDLERAVRVDQLARAGRARTIEVKPGDTLMGLAAKHLGSQARWEDLLAANRDKLSSPRSEEHTSELQSRENLVCRLLLEKKKTDTR